MPFRCHPPMTHTAVFSLQHVKSNMQTHTFTQQQQKKKCLIVELNKWCTDACGINKLDRFRLMSKRSGAAVCK